MASNLEDYAIIRDYETAALIGRGGSIDWRADPGRVLAWVNRLG